MKISKNTVVTVQYVLSDAQGNVIEQGNEPMIYLHGGYEGTLPKIEAALDGKECGFKTDIQLEPEDAFGEYDADLVKDTAILRTPFLDAALPNLPSFVVTAVDQWFTKHPAF